MLEKHLYDSWKSRMELYMQNREHGRMILDSIEHGLLIWPTIEENGVTRTKKYEELSTTEKIQADCDLRHKYHFQGYQTNGYSSLIIQIDFGFEVSVFKARRRPIFFNAINKMMSFLSTVVSSRFPTTNNQLRNSSKPRQQATIHNGRMTVNMFRETTSAPRVVKCFNCQGEGHTARQCPKPKRKRDATWFRDKVLLVEAQGSRKVLNKEELEFLADPGVAEGPVTQTVITHNASYQAEDLDAYDSDCDDFSIAKAVLMANLSSYGSDVLFEKQFLIENRSLLGANHFSSDISLLDMNTSVNVNSSVAMNDSVNYVEMCNKCLELEAELIKQYNMVEKDEYDRLSKIFFEVEQHCVSLEIAMQLNKEIFQKNNTSVNQTEPTFDQLFELNNLKAELQAKDTTIKKLKENIKSLNKTSTTNSAKIDIDEIDTINIELEHRNDRISRPPSSNEKNKVEVQSRKVKSSLNKKHSDSKNVCNEHVKDSVKGAKALCSICNECMFDGNHAICLIDHVNNVNIRAKSASKKNKKRKEWKPTRKMFNSVGYKWKPTGRTFTLVRNACPLTRITTTNKVPLREPIPLKIVAQEPVVTKVYTRIPKLPNTIGFNSKPKIVVQIVLWYLDSGCSKHMTGDRSQLTNFDHKFLGTVKFGNDQVAKIMGYGDYQIGNVTISRVVEGLGHNLFLVGQFCD
ncbi:retrovirus-related pol polyprotein from transposon TNT 1-94, partial [Tanacetum coccineum]